MYFIALNVKASDFPNLRIFIIGRDYYHVVLTLKIPKLLFIITFYGFSVGSYCCTRNNLLLCATRMLADKELLPINHRAELASVLLLLLLGAVITVMR